MAASHRSADDAAPLLTPRQRLSVAVHAHPPEAPPPPPPQRAAPAIPRKKVLLAAAFLLGAALWVCPHPAAVSDQAWHLLAIFVATIFAIVVQPLPTGAVAAVAAAVALLTHTLTYPQVFAAFSAEVPWLIAVAMFLASTVTATGLGRRVAYSLVSLLGARPLGLTYALVGAEALLAPAIPSVAARSGGIILPLVKGLCDASGSRADDGTGGVVGSYLMFTLFQTSAVSSAMFLTANHPNPLSAKFAEAATGQVITWGLWAQAAIVPGLLCLATVPLLTYALMRPTLTDSAAAQREARSQLSALGPLSRPEGLVIAAMGVTVSLWVWGHAIGVGAVAAALTGLSILLLTDVLTWGDCLGNTHAWDTMWWFAIVIGFATQLKALGLVDYVSSLVATGVSALGLGWQPSFAILLLVYFYSHYFFASNVAHVSAMYSAFLAVMVAAGAPPMLAALVLAFFSNTMGAISTWGMSHGPMYYGHNFLAQGRWLALSLVVSVWNIFIWLAAGSVWWRFLGLW